MSSLNIKTTRLINLDMFLLNNMLLVRFVHYCDYNKLITNCCDHNYTSNICSCTITIQKFGLTWFNHEPSFYYALQSSYPQGNAKFPFIT